MQASYIFEKKNLINTISLYKAAKSIVIFVFNSVSKLDMENQKSNFEKGLLTY